MSEHKVQNEIRNALAGLCLLFRANVGKAWQGEEQRLPNGDLLLRNPRPFSTGLPAGFSDLFGVATVEVTPDMVGKKVGLFLAMEVKSEKGRPTDRQKAFIDAINRCGGRAAVVRSPEDAMRILDGQS